MILYEVNIELEKQIEGKFLSWLKDHITEVCQAGGFISAQIFRVADKESCFSIHYLIENRDKLEIYLKNHAPKLRQKGIDQFGDKFKANRRILDLI